METKAVPQIFPISMLPPYCGKLSLGPPYPRSPADTRTPILVSTSGSPLHL